MEGLTVGETLAISLVLGVVMVAQSPAVVVALRTEMEADGPVSRTVLGVVVIGDFLVILLFAAASAVAKAVFGGGADVSETAQLLAWEIAGSLVAGLIIGGILAAYLCKVSEAGGFFVLATRFVVAEVGARLHFDPLIVALAAGVFVRNLARVGERLHDAIEASSLPVYVVFFAVAGASIHLDVLLVVGVPAVLLVLVRAGGLLAGARVGAALAKAPETVRRFAGYGLLPQAGLALALALLFKKTFPEFGDRPARSPSASSRSTRSSRRRSTALRSSGAAKRGARARPPPKPRAPTARCPRDESRCWRQPPFRCPTRATSGPVDFRRIWAMDSSEPMGCRAPRDGGRDFGVGMFAARVRGSSSGRSACPGRDDFPRSLSIMKSSGTKLRVLLVEDSADDAVLLVNELTRGDHQVESHRVDDPAALADALAHAWDIALVDYTVPGVDGVQALAEANRSGVELPFVVVSGVVTEAVIVDTLKQGASDYVLKSGLTRLRPAVERALHDARRSAAEKQLKDRLVHADRMATVGLLAASLAHEINNPLTIILANLEHATHLMRDPDAGMEAVDDALRDALTGARRLAQIVSDFRTAARRDTSSVADVARSLDAAVRLAESQIKYRARLVKDYAELPPVRADEHRLVQVFLNLLINAGQSIPPHRVNEHEIRIATRLIPPDRVSIRVCDSGGGIAAENLDRVFDPAFTTKPPAEGTGLGLWISKQIIDAVGGEISVESEVGRGTTFEVLLPVA